MKQLKYFILFGFCLFSLTFMSCLTPAETPKCLHEETEWVVKREATCDATGFKYEKCLDCGRTLKNEVIEKIEHDFKLFETVEPKCEEDGYEKYVCAYCKEEKVNVLDHIGHNLVHYEKLNPTCTTNGHNDYYECTRCSYTTYEEINMTGHVKLEWVIDVEATCLTDGVRHQECTECHETLKEEVIGALGHNKVDGLCTRCGDADYSVGLEYKLSSNSEYYIVTGIGECTDSNIVIPEKIHSLFVKEIGKQAFYGCGTVITIRLPDSIVKIGDKAFASCENLNRIHMPDNIEIGIDVFRDSIIVEIVIKHILVYVERKEPTCYENGNIEYYVCKHCNYYFSDPEGTTRIYDVLLPKTHKFENGVCTECGEVQSEVYITSIDEIANLGKFALGTLENAIGLPNKINVYTADGVKHALNIIWNLESYDKTKVGTYTIKGIIEATNLIFGEGLSNEISTEVEIVEQVVGTADIVFVLDISGSMGDEIANVKNNIITFAEKIEERGVSVRWSAITYSDFTCSSDKNEQSQIIENGASDWFTSVVDYKKAISGITLAYGGDTPEAAIDGLLLATTLSTRQDARIFYILLTDADYKMNNHYGVSTENEVINMLVNKGVNLSVITTSSCYSDYSSFTSSTGGILVDINSSFHQTLYNTLIPIIYNEVIE